MDGPGYLHSRYAESFADFGKPVRLSKCAGWLLERGIPSSSHRDVMGLYPLFCCQDWAALEDDVASLAPELVSLALVTDPLGSYEPSALERIFDFVSPFKAHFVADLSTSPGEFVSKNHRKLARRALRKVEVQVCEDPIGYLDEWVSLFGVLQDRHGISGIKAPSREAFFHQLSVPGLVMFRASHEGETVGLDLWYVQDDVAQGHLAAFSAKGYELQASYATKWTLLEHFHGKVHWVNFGGAAGTSAQPEGGLAQFKRGWSTSTRTAHFCGKVLDPARYAELAGVTAAPGYFPAYRSGEFR